MNSNTPEENTNDYSLGVVVVVVKNGFRSTVVVKLRGSFFFNMSLGTHFDNINLINL